MTLLDMATHICETVGRTDSVSLGLAKKYLRRRYQLIYDAHLWRDSIGVTTVRHWGTPDFDAEDPQRNDLILPGKVQRVLTIKDPDDMVLSQEEIVRMFLTNPGDLIATGKAVRYSFLQPVGSYAEESRDAVSQQFRVYSDSASDTAVKVTVRERPDLGRTKEVVTLAGTTVMTTSNPFKHPFISKTESVGNVTSHGIFGSSFWFSEYYTSEVTPGITGQPYVRLRPSESHINHIRIRLHDTPRETTNYTVVFKQRVEPLDSDSDFPQIEGIEDCLIAHSMADILERLRQYGKAREKRQEAAFQLEKMRKLEADQQVNIYRITPAIYDIAGDDYTDTNI